MVPNNINMKIYAIINTEVNNWKKKSDSVCLFIDFGF